MIRVATEHDLEAIASVHVASWRETYPGIIPDQAIAAMTLDWRVEQWRQRLTVSLEDSDVRAATFVAEWAGEVVGFAWGDVPTTASSDGRSKVAEVNTIYLLRSAQGCGLGRLLFTRLVSELAALGATSFFLWMSAGNPASGFYEHLGGMVSGSKKRMFGDVSIDAVRYSWDDIATVVG